MPRAFALRDAPPASAPSPHALARAELDALVDAFDELGRELVLDVARACVDAKTTLESLHSLSPARLQASFPTPSTSCASGFLGGTLPDDVRDEIFRYLSPRDAARAACACREFRALVGGWRRNARRLDLPRMDAVRRGTGEVGGRRVVLSVGAMIRAYPNVETVSFKRLGETLRREAESDDEAVVSLSSCLTAIAANNASRSIAEIDFSGCGEWMPSYAVVDVAERCRDLFPSLSSLALARAKTLGGDALASALRICGPSLRELRLIGCVKLDEDAVMRALELAPGLRSLDLTGCLALKRLALEARDVPRLEKLKAVNCAAMESCVVRRANREGALKSLNVADCVALRTFQVQSETLETLNVAGCRSLETFNAHAPRCETLLLNKCASLRHVTEEMHAVAMKMPSVRTLTLDSCKSLTTNGFARLLDMCGSLVALSAEGCLSVDRAVIASPSLLRCCVSGCPNLEVVRVSSTKCRVFVARACKSLAEVRFERCAYELDVFDVGNSSSLRRVVGVRRPRVRLIDVNGCFGGLEFLERAIG